MDGYGTDRRLDNPIWAAATVALCLSLSTLKAHVSLEFRPGGIAGSHNSAIVMANVSGPWAAGKISFEKQYCEYGKCQIIGLETYMSA